MKSVDELINKSYYRVVVVVVFSTSDNVRFVVSLDHFYTIFVSYFYTDSSFLIQTLTDAQYFVMVDHLPFHIKN